VISVQLSLYPLRQAHLSPAIEVVRDVLSAAGLRPAVGPMSTLVTGEKPISCSRHCVRRLCVPHASGT
jgi:uncharacterized protein YqgV (UPF0045/DUF77 family)